MFHDPTQRILRISGPDRDSFMQGLITNDMSQLATAPLYAALLSPQGKYLADFILLNADDALLLIAHQGLLPGLVQRLNMYRLRAQVEIAEDTGQILRGLTDAPDASFPDPRDPGLGWWQISPQHTNLPQWDDQALRIKYGVPAPFQELIPNVSYILEMGFERLQAVDFKKGCYVGQEVTARMKHKAELRKGLGRVTLADTYIPAKLPLPIFAADREAGQLTSYAQKKGLAYLRWDRVGSDMKAGELPVLEVERLS